MPAQAELREEGEKHNGREEVGEREHERRGRQEREEAWRSLIVEPQRKGTPENTTLATDGTHPRHRNAALGCALASHSYRPPGPTRVIAFLQGHVRCADNKHCYLETYIYRKRKCASMSKKKAKKGGKPRHSLNPINIYT
jgi:hypothetical protein